MTGLKFAEKANQVRTQRIGRFDDLIKAFKGDERFPEMQIGENRYPQCGSGPPLLRTNPITGNVERHGWRIGERIIVEAQRRQTANHRRQDRATCEQRCQWATPAMKKDRNSPVSLLGLFRCTSWIAYSLWHGHVCCFSAYEIPLSIEEIP